MSALYLIGLKQGDIQMTASGLVTAGLFFFLSQAQPLTKISTEKPPSTIFDRSVMVSIVGQFIVHFFCLLGMLSLCSKYISMEKYSQAPDGKFQPNLINSSFFLLSSMMQVNNFVVNYRGEPFTKSIFENTMLWRSVQILYLLVLILAGGQVEPLNDLLQMASFPSSEFQAYLVGILMCNLVGTYFIERLSQQLK